MNIFNPGSPRFRRGTVILSTIACTVVGAHVVMADFGTQKHIFTPIQAIITPKIDAFFGITEDEIKNYKEPEREKMEPWLQLQKGNKELTKYSEAGSIFDQTKKR